MFVKDIHHIIVEFLRHKTKFKGLSQQFLVRTIASSCQMCGASLYTARTKSKKKEVCSRVCVLDVPIITCDMVTTRVFFVLFFFFRIS